MSTKQEEALIRSIKALQLSIARLEESTTARAMIEQDGTYFEAKKRELNRLLAKLILEEVSSERS